MTMLWSYPINDPFDIDDAEHPANCACTECDATDIRFDERRERKLA